MHCGGEGRNARWSQRMCCPFVTSKTLQNCELLRTLSDKRSSSRRRTDRFLPPAGWRHLLLNLGIVSDLHNVFIFSAWGDALSSHFPDCPCVSDETCSTLCLLLKQESRWWRGHTGHHCVQNLPVQDVQYLLCSKCPMRHEELSRPRLPLHSTDAQNDEFRHYL